MMAASSKICFLLIFKYHVHRALKQFHSLCPQPNANHKCFPSQSGLTCQCPALSKTSARAQWLDGRFVLLASERAGPISKWAEPHVIPSKRRARDLIWEAEAQPARDVFR